MYNVRTYGRRSQEVKAPDCGSGIRGFESPRLPHIFILNLLTQLQRGFAFLAPSLEMGPVINFVINQVTYAVPDSPFLIILQKKQKQIEASDTACLERVFWGLKVQGNTIENLQF